jgi:hypothetical protein
VLWCPGAPGNWYPGASQVPGASSSWCSKRLESALLVPGTPGKFSKLATLGAYQVTFALCVLKFWCLLESVPGALVLLVLQYSGIGTERPGALVLLVLEPWCSWCSPPGNWQLVLTGAPGTPGAPGTHWQDGTALQHLLVLPASLATGAPGTPGTPRLRHLWCSQASWHSWCPGTLVRRQPEKTSRQRGDTKDTRDRPKKCQRDLLPILNALLQQYRRLKNPPKVKGIVTKKVLICS